MESLRYIWLSAFVGGAGRQLCVPKSSSVLFNRRLSELRLRSINPNASANELKTTLMSHSIIHGYAYFAYFNKIWGIP